ncbi:MauE/DoxX family redox-associated membrane protein [Nocardioides sp. GXQ0305]|uniref:MauE/DoxX family redox-associated membrane protein n=1 Tax=Nocardioides sp. GXQ0305 TaxID=3423912 RepID=UPI003D7ED44B
MSALFVPYAAAAVLLVVAGVPKLLDPAPTRRAAEQAGLPSSATVVRLLGLAETVVGVTALLVGGPVPATAVAVAYLGFAAVVTRGLLRGDLESCGCFNGTDAPPSPLHVALDLGLAASAVAVALGPTTSWPALAADEPGTALVTALLALTVAGLVYLVMARLPRVAAPVLRGATR